MAQSRPHIPGPFNKKTAFAKSFLKSRPDPYAILGLQRSASQKDIKAAYHDLCKRYHPDKDRSTSEANATARFQELKAAFEILNDPARRKALDDRVIVAAAVPSKSSSSLKKGEKPLQKKRKDPNKARGSDSDRGAPKKQKQEQESVKMEPVEVLDSDEEEKEKVSSEVFEPVSAQELARRKKERKQQEQERLKEQRLHSRAVARAAAIHRRQRRERLQEDDGEHPHEEESDDVKGPPEVDSCPSSEMHYIRLNFKAMKDDSARSPTKDALRVAFGDYVSEVVSLTSKDAVLSVLGDETQAVSCALLIHHWDTKEDEGTRSAACREVFRKISLAVAPVGVDGQAVRGSKATFAISKHQIASCSDNGAKLVAK
eukprot:TRINITY_DN94940_c0_g1_i1.p1 TRINITY_DN94940_c0_g1~~TRINITY_DN94940_c0_g1_i1.p1  ORF type:complete len:372 (+),score=86.59 TRINITY_DN94940_c0_g1_i1:87-1202(+)